MLILNGSHWAVLLERGAERDLEARLVVDYERDFGRRPVVEFYGGGGGPVEL